MLRQRYCTFFWHKYFLNDGADLAISTINTINTVSTIYTSTNSILKFINTIKAIVGRSFLFCNVNIFYASAVGLVVIELRSRYTRNGLLDIELLKSRTLQKEKNGATSPQQVRSYTLLGSCPTQKRQLALDCEYH